MATPEEVAAMQREAANVTGNGESFFLKNIGEILAQDPSATFVAIDVDHNRFVTGVSRQEVHDKADKMFAEGSRVYVRGVEKMSPDVTFGPCPAEASSNAR